jgi:hypothetical protein
MDMRVTDRTVWQSMFFIWECGFMSEDPIHNGKRKRTKLDLAWAKGRAAFI